MLVRKTPLKRSLFHRGAHSTPTGTSTRGDARRNLRPRSKRQAERERRLAALKRELIEQRGPWCHGCTLRWMDRQEHEGLAATAAEGCSGYAEVLHHRKLRSQGGTDDPTNLELLGVGCHQWAHANPAEAARLGLIEMRHVRIIEEES